MNTENNTQKEKKAIVASEYIKSIGARIKKWIYRPKKPKYIIAKQTFVKRPKKTWNPIVHIWYLIKLLLASVISLLGTASGVLKATITVICAVFFATCIVAGYGYTKLKPQIEECREIAYDTLVKMQREDFTMMSDTEVYDVDNNLIGLINTGHYEYATIDNISLNIQNAYIAQEDRRFKSHYGVDFLATIRAALSLVKNGGEITQGASSITQQVIKNTYLSQERTFVRKITEILLAPEVEKRYSKADIMEFYCNTCYYANRRYGVESASKYYFGKSAKDLEVWEAATLAGISNRPAAYDPIKHPEESTKKRNAVLKSMLESEFITEDEYNKAINKPLGIVQEEQEGTDENYMVSYAIHCAALELMNIDGFEFKYVFEDKNDYDTYMSRYNSIYNEKAEMIRSGGYKIYTSLDPTIQEKVQNRIDTGLAKFTERQENGKYALQGAAVVVDNNTGYVVAIVGGRGEDDQFNRGYLSARQPGSTIKPLIDYAPAFDTGEYYPSKVIDDHKWEDGPSNSGSYYGRVTIREALNRSLNTVAWQILDGIGVDKGLSYLGRMHFQKLTYVDNGVKALSIGGFTNGVRVVDMAKGYSTLANYGLYDDKTCITALYDSTNSDKDLMKDSIHQTYQVYTEDTAYMITDILKGTMTSPYGTGRGLDLANDQIAAGKTGTTNSSKDTWFCGYTRDYSTAVWVAYDTPRAMPGTFGATYAGSIWKHIMDDLMEGREIRDWEKPETVVLASYNASNGSISSGDTGLYDYFSTSANVLAERTAYERKQKSLAEELEAVVDEYESWFIATVEDTYLLEEKTDTVRTKVSEIEDIELRKPLMERVQNHHSELKKIALEMQEDVRLYEEMKQREEDDAKKEEERLAAEERKLFEYEAREKDFKYALRDVTNLKYQAENAEALCLEAEKKLEYLVGYENYETYKQQLRDAVDNIKNLPTILEWQKAEDARIKAEREAEEARLRQQQEELMRQQEEFKQQLDNEAEQWNKITGPGVGPSASSEPVIGPGAALGPGVQGPGVN